MTNPETPASLTELEIRSELFDAMDGNLRMSKRRKLLDAYRDAVLAAASAAVSVPPPARQAAARRERYAAAIAEGFRAFDADTTSDAYLDAELLDAVVAVADAEEAVTRADAQAAVLNRAADEVFALDYDAMVGEEGDENLGSMREAWDLGTIHAEKLLRRLADESGPRVAGEQQNETPEARQCAYPHPADEHSVYGCVDGCGCEWMPKRPKLPPMDPVHILGIEAPE